MVLTTELKIISIIFFLASSYIERIMLSQQNTDILNLLKIQVREKANKIPQYLFSFCKI